MTQRLFRNQNSIKYAKVCGYLLIIPSLSSILLIFCYLILNPKILFEEFSQVFGTTISLFLNLFIASYIINYFPDIKIEDEYIYIQFFWFWIKTPWERILFIKRIKTFLFRQYIVCSEELTFFHRLYGLLFLFSPKACFLINTSLDSYEDLVNEIEAHTKHHQLMKHN